MSKAREDNLLVEKARAGDKVSYRELVEKYQGRLYAIVFEIVKSNEDAQDITQESFVKAYLSLKDFKGQSSFYTWLYRIAFNMAIDFKRRQARRGGDPMAFDEERFASNDAFQTPFGAPSEGPQDLYLKKERLRLLNQGLQEISEEHRAVIMLREVEGLSYDEIADVTGITKGTVMSRLHYARKKLQKYLETESQNFSGESGDTSQVSANISKTPEKSEYVKDRLNVSPARDLPQ
jgi:RNA polymerase sigma-70 factor (ECF subfamily)